MFEEPSEAVLEPLRGLEEPLAQEEQKAGQDSLLANRLRAFRLWVHYCLLCKESEFHEKVSRDKERGRAVEQAVRDWLRQHREFLATNGLASPSDVDYMAGPVVDRRLRLFQ